MATTHASALSRSSDIAWRAAWIADIQKRARIEIPALLRSAHAQRLRPLLIKSAVTSIAPTTPLPETRLPETGALPRLQQDTAVISAVRLLKPAIAVRDTKRLVSSAVQRFFDHYGFLPHRCALSPLRLLAIENPHFYPLDETCAEFGSYTIACSAANIESDTVRLQGTRGADATVCVDYCL